MRQYFTCVECGERDLPADYEPNICMRRWPAVEARQNRRTAALVLALASWLREVTT